MIDPRSGIISWLVPFIDVKMKQSIARYCRPGFQHVFAMGYSAINGVWTIVDADAGRLHLAILDDQQADGYLELARLDTSTTLVVKQNYESVFTWSRPLYCVTVIQGLLGLPGFYCTPFQLYKGLIAKLGATHWSG